MRDIGLLSFTETYRGMRTRTATPTLYLQTIWEFALTVLGQDRACAGS